MWSRLMGQDTKGMGGWIKVKQGLGVCARDRVLLGLVFARSIMDVKQGRNGS